MDYWLRLDLVWKTVRVRLWKGFNWKLQYCCFQSKKEILGVSQSSNLKTAWWAWISWQSLTGEAEHRKRQGQGGAAKESAWGTAVALGRGGRTDRTQGQWEPPISVSASDCTNSTGKLSPRSVRTKHFLLTLTWLYRGVTYFSRM